MRKNKQTDINNEYKKLTNYLFNGYTIPKIAVLMNYSQSSVSNKLKELYMQYGAKSRREFIFNLFGIVIKENKKIIKEQNKEIEKLKIANEKLKETIKKIIRKFNEKIKK